MPGIIAFPTIVEHAVDEFGWMFANTLVDHSGEMIEDVGWFWDHADRRHLIAHDYVIANYVCTSGKHYPLEFRRFRKRAACAEDEPASPFKSHTTLFKELVDEVVEREIPGDFAFDSYFSSAESLNHIQGHKRGYVGDLKSNRKVWFKGEEMKAGEWAAGIASDDRQRVTSAIASNGISPGLFVSLTSITPFAW